MRQKNDAYRIEDYEMSLPMGGQNVMKEESPRNWNVKEADETHENSNRETAYLSVAIDSPEFAVAISSSHRSRNTSSPR